MKKIMLSGLLLFLVLFSVTSLELTTYYQESAPKYYEDGGTIKGICTDIITELNKSLKSKNISIVLKDSDHPFLPFKRIQEYLGDGKIDIFVGLAKSAAREKIYTYIKTPAYGVVSTFAKLKSDNFDYTGPASLAGKKIGYVSGSKTGKQIVKIDGVIGDPSPDLKTALLKLSKGRTDLVFYHSLGLGFTTLQSHLDNVLDMTSSPYLEYAHYVALNKSVPSDVVAAIESAMKTLTDNGTIDEIMGRYR